MIASEGEARTFVEELGSNRAIERLEELVASLCVENTHQNLVAARSLDSVWQRHLADSAQLLHHVSRETLDAPWLDLGSGAGFPGLVIAILRPEWPVVLVESRKRRIEWLTRMVVKLGLERCRIEGKRLELLDTFSASVISARAFAPMPRLLSLSRRFSTSDTVWLLPKGRSAEQEVAGLPRGMRRMFHVEPSLTDPESGIIVGRNKEALPQ
ncbi:16S rRNA (guanine(527)-N(7))-methyltransferase RsmG [Tsuneonella mangrovi]|uniref:16S rRNA (guanine(527)-N(7))-methyltransferase RsmG n=1 Tax=Tsuneonella mangrovi TaxID=1982042 RepID=UPI000BA1F015|nr:16S rRNA (guanine(527)-N(7))-methyltransferase RsmG [Tsuneonella mangrovi]